MLQTVEVQPLFHIVHTRNTMHIYKKRRGVIRNKKKKSFPIKIHVLITHHLQQQQQLMVQLWYSLALRVLHDSFVLQRLLIAVASCTCE